MFCCCVVVNNSLFRQEWAVALGKSRSPDSRCCKLQCEAGCERGDRLQSAFARALTEQMMKTGSMWKLMIFECRWAVMSLSPRKKRAKMERRAARTVSWTFHQQNTLSKVEGKSKTPISDAVPALFSSFVLWRKSGLMRYAWMSGVVRTIWWRPVTSGNHFAQKRQNWDRGFTCRSTGASSLCLKKPSALRKKGWKNLMTEIHRCAKCGLSLFDNCNARFF